MPSSYSGKYDHDGASAVRIADRCIQYENNFQVFWDTYVKTRGAPPMKVNKAIVASAVTSYFIDIHRLKEYHLESERKADRFKVAGFTMKWLAKSNAVQIDESHFHSIKDENVKKMLLLANCVFAMTNGMNIANIDPKSVPKEVVMDIMYDLHYRNVEGTVLAQIMKFMAALWPKNDNALPDWARGNP